MKFESLSDSAIDYTPCRYGSSRLFFRGPKRDLNEPYVAFMGGTDVYGRYMKTPVSDLVERATGMTCVNFGVPNASIDAFFRDGVAMGLGRRAEVTFFHITGAHNLSNRFYQVHPRRNDRFLQASSVLRALYDDVDFTEFAFTRHLLQALYERSAARFDIVVHELQTAWVSRMRSVLDQLNTKVVLVWWSERPLTNDNWDSVDDPFKGDQLFINRGMVDQLSDMASEVVELRPSLRARQNRTLGMQIPMLQISAADEQLSFLAHSEASQALAPVLGRMMQKGSA